MKAKCDWNKASPVEPLDRLAVPKKALTHWTKLWQLQVLHPMFCTLNSKGYLPQQPCLHPPHQFCRVALKRKTEKIGKSTWVNSSLKTFIAILNGTYFKQLISFWRVFKSESPAKSYFGFLHFKEIKVCYRSRALNPNWHDLWKKEKSSSLAPPRGNF